VSADATTRENAALQVALPAAADAIPAMQEEAAALIAGLVLPE
jgi:hypothetical protein